MEQSCFCQLIQKQAKQTQITLWCVIYLFVPVCLLLIHRLKAKMRPIFKLPFQSYEFRSSHDSIRSCLETTNWRRLFLVLLYMTLGSVITATGAPLILVSRHFLQKPRVTDPPSQGWKEPRVFPSIQETIFNFTAVVCLIPACWRILGVGPQRSNTAHMRAGVCAR